MKLQPRQIPGFLANPDPAIRAVLVYGPDAGLVAERADMLGRTVVADLTDPFRVTELSAQQIAEDPARLPDEANAFSMLGGRRLVRVRGAGNALAAKIEDFLNQSGGDYLVVIEAGDLAPGGALRKLFEKIKTAAALPCYTEDAGDVGQLARRELAQAGLALEHDAQAWLGLHLVGNRQLQRREIEKLLLYVTGQDRVTLADVQAVIGDSGAVALEDLAMAAAGGKQAALIRALDRLQGEGVSAIAVLRAAQSHLLRLHEAGALLRKGKTPDQAMAALRPPVFFKSREKFRGQMRRWREADLNRALAGLVEAEARCKQTGAPAELLAARALTATAALAART